MFAGKLAGLSRNPWIIRIALLLSIVSAIAAMVLLNNIDRIVNVELYNYGLQFDSVWYNPYSLYTQLFYASLGISVAISVIVLLLTFINIEKTENVEGKKLKVSKSEIHADTGKSKAKEQVVDTTCPACKRIFSKPVMMLNLVNGKPKMVSTCPYCSQIIATEDK